MSAFGFPPSDRFPGGGPFRQRPRVVRTGHFGRGRRIATAIIAAIVIVLIVAYALMGLRVQLLFLGSLDHSNVFWTPFWTQVVLFLIGFVITGALTGVSVIGWRAAAATLDRDGGRVALIVGIILTLVVAIAGGIYLAAQWQDVQLWLHGQSFGRTDPAFHQDFSFFLFTLPVLDDLQALGWTAAVIGLLGALGMLALCILVETAPEEMPLPLRPPAGRSAQDGLRIAALHCGLAIAGIFVMAALGAHFGVYHLATSNHDNFVGLDATQRNVERPVLGALQVVALLFAVAALVVVWMRRRSSGTVTAIVAGSLLGGWLLVAGLAQAIPSAIYQATSVNPNAQQAQSPSIGDFLTTSRYAWALQSGGDVETRPFGAPRAPTSSDLLADPGTLTNVRVQDTRQLPETFAQIDRSRSYQSYPSITVDRYPGPTGETEVMLAPREIAEGDVPNNSFVNRSLLYTHGYGITAVSVSQLGSEGKPYVYAGRQPLQLVAPDSPPDLNVSDPRIYCGLETTQPVIVNTTQSEFDYPSGGGDHTSHGSGTVGLSNPGVFDKLAISLNQFNGVDFFLTSSLTPDSRVLLHRQIADRIQTLAPFLRLDGDPYVVADPQSGHLVFIQDAYVATDRFPESYQQSDGTSYMRNAVKAVVDARTCQTTLYAVDPSEPLTATYSAIYPGLLTPLSKLPASLRAHLRYPEDLFQAQAQAYASVHITDPNVLYNRSDLWRLSQETVSNTNQTQTTHAYYVELSLPGDRIPRFVLLQTFSPATSTSGGTSNVMTAWLAASCDYSTPHPKLVAVPLNNADNVLGPLQFDNNINTNTDISSQITLLSQSGSQVQLGNVLVLPFNNQTFLYVRPMYVTAATGSFPQLKFVIVGTQNSVARGSSFADALTNLFGATFTIPGQATPSPGPSPSPGTSPGPSPSPSPSPGGPVNPQVVRLVQDLLQHETAAQAALNRRDYTTYGQEEAAIQRDIDQLRQLVGPGASVTPAPSPSPSPTR